MLKCSLPMSVLKKYNLKDRLQVNHALHFNGSRYIFKLLEARALKVKFEKHLIGRKS